MEDIILDQNKNLAPIKDRRGFRSNLFSSDVSDKLKDSLQSNYLNAFKKTYHLKIDELYVASDFLISEKNHQLGLETVIPLKNIEEGKHLLHVSRFITSKKTKGLEKENVIKIPFWYYK